ncbi:repetitive organellar protein-like [Microplitis mediator]|uniref:repetitive organellar protein-like n=1 Tax=Microplitis mediator TaxID=375433 RepID=UPI00255428DF|nr:repetitive organellar protein-like [Microplitis mediator]
MDSDYYSTIYAWFERCGIISNIRTHLRHNLVNTLKSTDMTLNKDNSGPKSAKQYIYDLLIAEYLWNHNYAYTLSVFASEAPLLINFRKHIKTDLDNEAVDKQKLQSDYVTHVLETLGIRPDDSDGQSIIDDYNSNDLPLLLTVLKFTCQFKCNYLDRDESRKCKDVKACESQTDFKFYDICKEKHKIICARKKLVEQKESYENQLKEYEDKVKNRVDFVEEQVTLLDDKLMKAQNMIKEINEREDKLTKEKEELERYIFIKNKELVSKENALAREAKRLQKDNDGYKIFETNLKKLQDELAKVQIELSNKSKDCKVIRTHEVSTQTDVVDKIGDNNNDDNNNDEEEKKQLQSLVQEQQLRIEELTLRSVRLSRQLEEAQLVKPVVHVDVTRSLFSKTQTILSESSSTDDIIQDAKQRLKRLEEESLKADQSYLNCITGLPL